MRIYEAIYEDRSLFSSLQLEDTGRTGRTWPRNNRRSAHCRTLGGRPCQTTQIYEGTNQIQRMVIARKTFSGVR
jgi:alkylation response protein AidB-like acyl-CoA dehydrogenase